MIAVPLPLAVVIGVVAVAPSSAAAQTVCAEGTVTPGKVVRTLPDVLNSTDLTGTLARPIAGLLSQFANELTSADSSITVERICPKGV